MIELAILLFGACIGSFLNVCIHRIPRSQSIVHPGSRCPCCGKSIKWYENIPIVSYVLLRGRCSSCGMRISPVYPMVEGLTALLFWGLYRVLGLGIPFFFFLPFVASLVVVSFIDLEHKIIPDVITIPGMIYGLLGSFLVPGMRFWDSLLGLLFGGGVLFAVAWGYYLLTRREGMGGGDIKLLAMIGAFLGWQSIPIVLFLSALMGSIVGGGVILFKGSGPRTQIPFGPFLSLGALLHLLVPGLESIISSPLK